MESYRKAVLKNKGTYPELGADYFDKLNADGLKRYCVRKLEVWGIGLFWSRPPDVFKGVSVRHARVRHVAGSIAGTNV